MQSLVISDPDSAAPLVIHRFLQCIAGFYLSEAQARSALVQLAGSGGLLPTQVQLLDPGRPGRLRFAVQARHWSGRWPFVGGSWTGKLAWLGALTGMALCLLAIAVGALQLDASDLADLHWSLMLLALVVTQIGCGAIWLAVMSFLDRGLKQRHFDDTVRRHLQAGQWPVIASGVPASLQGAVVRLLQGGSAGWSAAAGRNPLL